MKEKMSEEKKMKNQKQKPIAKVPCVKKSGGAFFFFEWIDVMKMSEVFFLD